VSVIRYELDRTALVLASVNAPGFPVGSRWPLDGPSCFASVLSTGAPARIDDISDLPGPLAAGARASGVRSGLAVPILVDGVVWGMIAVGRKQQRQALPGFAGSYTGRIVYSTEREADVEARLVAFTDLIATAISRAQAHDDLQRLAEEQAALRRVATLVAEAAPPDVIFTAVAEEVASILELPRIEVVRYEADGSGTVVGASGDHPFAAGSHWTLDGPSIMRTVFQTSRPARIDDYSSLPGMIAEAARAAGFRSAVGAPIIVDGRTWGTIIAISTLPDPIPERSEIRLRQFTELVATAVSNATARAQLIASRARIVAAADDARRRFERNLHDGTQQRLVTLRFELERIRTTIPETDGEARSALEEAERDVESVLEEVREVAQGLHPAHLALGGLGSSLYALAARSPIEVALDVDIDTRPPAPIETAVYYVISEALANATKHSGASRISVTVASDETALRATIADDGSGGAAAGIGSGLIGLNDRVEALGGRFALSARGGTARRSRSNFPSPRRWRCDASGPGGKRRCGIGHRGGRADRAARRPRAAHLRRLLLGDPLGSRGGWLPARAAACPLADPA
jgi:signal transduction histidine kinase